jgi:hypothetical protein
MATISTSATRTSKSPQRPLSFFSCFFVACPHSTFLCVFRSSRPEPHASEAGVEGCTSSAPKAPRPSLFAALVSEAKRLFPAPVAACGRGSASLLP